MTGLGEWGTRRPCSEGPLLKREKWRTHGLGEIPTLNFAKSAKFRMGHRPSIAVEGHFSDARSGATAWEIPRHGKSGLEWCIHPKGRAVVRSGIVWRMESQKSPPFVCGRRHKDGGRPKDGATSGVMIRRRNERRGLERSCCCGDRGRRGRGGWRWTDLQ